MFDKLPVATILLSEILKPDVFKTRAGTPVTQVSRTNQITKRKRDLILSPFPYAWLGPTNQLMQKSISIEIVFV